MFYRYSLLIIIFLLLSNCSVDNLKTQNIKKFEDNYRNRGFALIYNENLYNNKIVSYKLDERSLIVFQENLKTNTYVKITNILNNKAVIGRIGKKSSYPSFYNSVISPRIAKELSLNESQPYVEISTISKNTAFIANKAKTYDEEKKVADKAPVNSISINDLNKKNIKKIMKKTEEKFSYIIKIADFYFNDTALIMTSRIDKETNIKKSKILKISDKKYRVFLGPFDNIYSLQKSFNDINILEFENIEIIKND